MCVWCLFVSWRYIHSCTVYVFVSVCPVHSAWLRKLNTFIGLFVRRVAFKWTNKRTTMTTLTTHRYKNKRKNNRWADACGFMSRIRFHLFAVVVLLTFFFLSFRSPVPSVSRCIQIHNVTIDCDTKHARENPQTLSLDLPNEQKVRRQINERPNNTKNVEQSFPIHNKNRIQCSMLTW